MLRFQQRVFECRQKTFADELVHQLAAAAVRHQDVRVLLDRNRTTVFIFIFQRMKCANGFYFVIFICWEKVSSSGWPHAANLQRAFAEIHGQASGQLQCPQISLHFTEFIRANFIFQRADAT